MANFNHGENLITPFLNGYQNCLPSISEVPEWEEEAPKWALDSHIYRPTCMEDKHNDITLPLAVLRLEYLSDCLAVR